MKQFSNFTFVKQVPLEELQGKFNMSYRLNILLEEKIKLAKYGHAIQHISFSPLIGEVFSPSSKYIVSKHKLEVEFLLHPEKAVEATEDQFFNIMKNGLLKAIQKMDLPSDFDFKTFQKDLKALRFEQLEQVVV